MTRHLLCPEHQVDSEGAEECADCRERILAARWEERFEREKNKDHVW